MAHGPLFFFYRFKLNDHLVFHSGETPWACDKCVYAAPTKQKLTRHKRVSHKEVLPFKCEQCGLMFGQNMALLTHMKTHEEKKFECKVGFLYGQGSETDRMGIS